MAARMSRSSSALIVIVLFALYQCAISRHHVDFSRDHHEPLKMREEIELASQDCDRQLPKPAAEVTKVVISQCTLNLGDIWCCASDPQLGCFKGRETCMSKCPPWPHSLGV